jgi:hypothetical protein
VPCLPGSGCFAWLLLCGCLSSWSRLTSSGGGEWRELLRYGHACAAAFVDILNLVALSSLLTPADIHHCHCCRLVLQPSS